MKALAKIGIWLVSVLLCAYGLMYGLWIASIGSYQAKLGNYVPEGIANYRSRVGKAPTKFEDILEQALVDRAYYVVHHYHELNIKVLEFREVSGKVHITLEARVLGGRRLVLEEIAAD